MMHQQRAGLKRNHSRGESMLMALILLMVFMALGASLLSRGAASSGAASTRIVERQADHVLRSVFDTVDEMIRKRELGLALQNEAYGALITAGGEAVGIPETSAPFQIELSGLPEGVESAGGTLTFFGNAQQQTDEATGAQQAYIELTARIVYTLTYRDKMATLTANYTYSGYAVSSNGSAPVWNGEWTLKEVKI